MLLQTLIGDPALFVAVIAALLLAITVHEAAHAYAAKLLGDDTAEMMGRLSLNPLAHLDPLGTVMLLVVGFGWGKPVAVNPNRLRSPWDEILVSLAGPASNLVTATILGVILRFVPLNPAFALFFSALLFYELILMFFNLIPVPPLDGSKLLRPLIGTTAFEQFERIGPILLVALVLFGQSVGVFSVLLGLTQRFGHLLGGGAFSFF